VPPQRRSPEAHLRGFNRGRTTWPRRLTRDADPRPDAMVLTNLVQAGRWRWVCEARHVTLASPHARPRKSLEQVTESQRLPRWSAMAPVRHHAWQGNPRGARRHACRVRRATVGPPPGRRRKPGSSSHRSRLARGDRDRRDAPASGSALERGLGLNCPTNAPVERRGERHKEEVFAGSKAERFAETRSRHRTPARCPPGRSRSATHDAEQVLWQVAARQGKCGNVLTRVGQAPWPHRAHRRKDD
jgi:hypothetical protein